MADRTMQVEIVELEGRVWGGPAVSLIARTQEGEIGILPGHSPLIALLAETGVVRVRTPEGTVVAVAAHGGGMSVQGDTVSVLAETAETAEEIDVERAERALSRAREAAAESIEARLAEERALTRLTLAGRL